MGANSSKVEVESTTESDTTFFSQRTSPVQFSDSLINHLSSSSPSSNPNAPSSSRQETLDSHIQSRINQELKRLKEEEQEVKLEIEKALEKENLVKEAGDGVQGSGISHSVSLMRDLEELEKRTQAKREESKKDLASGVWAEVEGGRLTLTECLLYVYDL